MHSTLSEEVMRVTLAIRRRPSLLDDGQLTQVVAMPALDLRSLYLAKFFHTVQ